MTDLTAYNGGQAFDCTQHNVATIAGSQMPVSDEKGHLVVITEESAKPGSNDASSLVIHLTVKGVEGVAKGTTKKVYLNFVNASPMAQQIGREQLTAIGLAVGIPQITDTAHLLNRPFRVVVAQETEEGKEQYTKVVGFLDQYGNTPSLQSSQAAGVQAAGVQAGGPPASQPVVAAPVAAQPQAAQAPVTVAATTVAQPAVTTAQPAPAPAQATGAAPWE